MLNADSQLVYDALRSITGDDDVYKIIEADEVLERLPKDKQFSKVQLSAIVRDLKDREYISVKYFTPDEYCLLTMKHYDESAPVEATGDVQVAEVVEVKGERVRYEKKKSEQAGAPVKKGIVFLMAFLGALLGSAVIAAVAIVLEKFVL